MRISSRVEKMQLEDQSEEIKSHAIYENRYPAPTWSKRQVYMNRIMYDICECNKLHPNITWEKMNPTITHYHTDCCGCCFDSKVRILFHGVLCKTDFFDVDLGLQK